MANWGNIREEWENSRITLKDLAEKHNIKLGTLKSRKSREKWSRDGKDATQLKKDATKNSKDATKNSKDATQRGAPKGNKNAAGNKGGAAPKGNKNAQGNRGGKPPPGNKNAVTTGEYETIMWDYLDDDEKELFEVIETDPLYQIDITIRELSIRQRRMMKRIKKLEDGLTESERRVLQELKDLKDIHVVEKDGVEVRVPVRTSALVVTEIEEKQYRKIDDILNVEEALTRITNQLVKAIKQKHDIEKSLGEQPLKEELLQANIDRIRAEVDNLSDNTEDAPFEIIITRKDDSS